MQIKKLEIEDIVLLSPNKFEDSRGYFFEAFKAKWFKENIANVDFVQDNQSLSRNIGVIRGLHYQKSPFGQGKLVRCIKGEIFDVAVDIRPNSPTYGRYVSAELSAQNANQLWIPDGFAHGFCTLTPDCEVLYKVTNPYNKECDAGIAFDDDEIGIKWPIDIKPPFI